MKERFSFKALIFPGLLVLLGLFILFLNFDPSVRISGWDNHQSELNFLLNISRSFSSAWQEFQGLGTATGMAMAAELPKQLLTGLLSIAVPANNLRFVYIGACYILGPLGMYFFLRDLFSQNGIQRKHEIFAFLGALFYMLNLHTLQVFYTPIEMFTAHFAALPWLLLLTNRYQRSGSIKYLLIYSLVTFFFSTQFITSTIFVVFCGILLLFSTRNLFGNSRKAKFKELGLLWLATIVMNSYWLIPAVFYFLSNSTGVLGTKISEMYSPEIARRVASFGTPNDYALMQNFFFGSSDWAENGWVPLMQPWINYLNNGIIVTFAYILFGIIIVGAISSIVRKSKYAGVFIILLAISFFMLINSNPPTGAIYNYIFEKVPAIREIFRASYTKFCTLTIFTFAYFFSEASAGISAILEKVMTATITRFAFLLPALILLIGINLPVFQGDLIYSRLKVTIPDEYHQLSQHLEKEKEKGRILLLPMTWSAGWRYYSWGYRGSGFMWYETDFPIIDRAFDVWNPNNETVFHEFYDALYDRKDDPKAKQTIADLLKKYQIKYILVDSNLINEETTINYRKLLNQIPGIKLDSKFNKLSLYESPTVSDKNFLSGLSNYKNILPDTPYLSRDQAYSENSDYISQEKFSSVRYPFRNLERGTTSSISIGDTAIQITSNKQSDITGLIKVPSLFSQEEYIPIDLSINNENQVRAEYNPPKIMLQDKSLTDIQSQSWTSTMPSTANYVSVPGYSPVELIGRTMSFLIPMKESSTIDFYPYQGKTKNVFSILAITPQAECWKLGTNRYFKVQRSQSEITYTAKNTATCQYYQFLPSSKVPLLAKITIELKSKTEDTLRFCLRANNTDYCDVFGEGEFVGSWKKSAILISLPASNKPYTLSLLLNAPADNKNHSVTFRSLSAEIIEPNFSFKINPEDIVGIKDSFTESLLNTNTNDLYLQMNKEIDTTSASLFSRFEKNSAYNTDMPGTTYKKTLTQRGLEYLSIDNTSLDDVTVPNLFDNQGYIVDIREINDSGQAQQYYVKRQEDTFNLLEEWTSTKAIKLPSGTSSLHTPYEFVLENTSYSKRDHTTNILESINLYPVPYNWLKSIKIISGNPNYSSDIIIKESSQKGTSLYFTTVESKSDTSILAQYQSYDTLWLAFSGLTPLQHVKVNNWANGWIVPTGSHRITIIYLPQIFQWLGYLAIPSFIAILITKSRKKKAKKTFTQSQIQAVQISHEQPTQIRTQTAAPQPVQIPTKKQEIKQPLHQASHLSHTVQIKKK